MAMFFLTSFINGLKASESLDSKINVANLFTSCSGNNFFKANISFFRKPDYKTFAVDLDVSFH